MPFDGTALLAIVVLTLFGTIVGWAVVVARREARRGSGHTGSDRGDDQEDGRHE